MAPLSRWLAWSVYVMALTTALLMPVPIDAKGNVALQKSMTIFSKTVHVSSFAVLTVLTLWLPLRAGRRWPLGVFLISYAMLTEYLQYVMDVGRVGSWLDVCFNSVGITLGLVIVKWWLRPRSLQPQEAPWLAEQAVRGREE